MRDLKDSFVLLISLLVIFPVVSYAEQIDLKEGESYKSIRKKLMNDGWVPLKSFSKLKDGTYESELSDARIIKEAGFIEVEACSGTGQNYCKYNFKRSNSCMQIVSVGEYSEKHDSPKYKSYELVDCKTIITKSSK